MARDARGKQSAALVVVRRLLRLQRAYGHANPGDELLTEKKVDEALGREAEAASILRAVFAKAPLWLEMLARLPVAGLFPDDPAMLARIKALAR